MIVIGYLTKKSKSKASHVGFDASKGFKPNPANQTLAIHYLLPKNTNNAIVSIMDMMGKVIYTEKLDTQTRIQSINTSNFTNGIYNLAIVGDGKHVANKKLVINH
jgi:hypothetical protein